jgi:hypothetical protein
MIVYGTTQLVLAVECHLYHPFIENVYYNEANVSARLVINLYNSRVSKERET